MSPKSSPGSITTSCHRCPSARRQGLMGCSICLNKDRLKNSFPKVKIPSRLSAGHVEATVLLAILKRHANNPRARSTALEAVERPPSNIRPSKNSRNPAVRLAKRNPDKDTPAIWLHPAEDTAPTIHYYSWYALGRPVPRENKLYVGMNNIRKPHHVRGEHCELCIQDNWMNASLCLMGEDLSKLEMTDKEEESGATKQPGEQRKLTVKKAFGNLRESFRSQSSKSAITSSHEGSTGPLSKPEKHQETKGRKLWRS